MVKKLIKQDIAISQKINVIKLNHFYAIFSIDKAKKLLSAFFGTEEVLFKKVKNETTKPHPFLLCTKIMPYSEEFL